MWKTYKNPIYKNPILTDKEYQDRVDIPEEEYQELMDLSEKHEEIRQEMLEELVATEREKNPHFDEAKFRSAKLAEWCAIIEMCKEEERLSYELWDNAANEVMCHKIQVLLGQVDDDDEAAAA